MTLCCEGPQRPFQDLCAETSAISQLSVCLAAGGVNPMTAPLTAPQPEWAADASMRRAPLLAPPRVHGCDWKPAATPVWGPAQQPSSVLGIKTALQKEEARHVGLDTGTGSRLGLACILWGPGSVGASATTAGVTQSKLKPAHTLADPATQSVYRKPCMHFVPRPTVNSVPRALLTCAAVTRGSARVENSIRLGVPGSSVLGSSRPVVAACSVPFELSIRHLTQPNVTNHCPDALPPVYMTPLLSQDTRCSVRRTGHVVLLSRASGEQAQYAAHGGIHGR